MNGSITWEQVMALLVIGGVIAGVWAKVSSGIGEVQKALGEFKLEVTRDYARNGYINDVEQRVLTRLGEVVTEIHGLREDISKMAQVLMGKK